MPENLANSPLARKYIGVAAIYNDRGQILIDRRPLNAQFGGLWEFPGGKVEAGETATDCIRREIREELGIDVAVGEHLITVEYDYDRFSVTLVVHRCQYLGGEVQLIGCDEARWVSASDLDLYSFPEANQKIVAALQKYQRSPDSPHS